VDEAGGRLQSEYHRPNWLCNNICRATIAWSPCKAIICTMITSNEVGGHPIRWRDHVGVSAAVDCRLQGSRKAYILAPHGIQIGQSAQHAAQDVVIKRLRPLENAAIHLCLRHTTSQQAITYSR
jgi:hypothetical protein